LDGGRPKALGALVATERCVPLKQDGRIAERAPVEVEVREAKKGGRDHLDRAIADGVRETRRGGAGLAAKTVAIP